MASTPLKKSPLKIDQPIVGWSVKESKDEPEYPPVITFDRTDELDGTTYKIKPPQIGCAMYITINHVKLPDGSKRPLEIFINSKKADQHQWIAGLTRMMSAVFHKPGPIDFVIEEMEEVYDPNGGYYADGKFQQSILSHIGAILRRHCEKIGAIESRSLTDVQIAVIEEKKAEANAAGIEMQRCGKCKEDAVIMMDGCLTCTSCGDSKCN